ncbi:MAG: Fic family protein [Bacilli bacterium]|nr:Fic family protein [Bacilli bacterium]
MANNEFAYRFTDEKYVTKTELPRMLGSSLIEPFWIQIENYRKANAKRLALRSLTQIPFAVTMTPVIAHKIQLFEEKLASFKSSYLSLGEAPRVQEKLSQSAKIDILSAINSIEKLQASDLSIKAMLNGTYRESNFLHQPLLGYREALSKLEDKYLAPITEDLLADMYGEILGQAELTSFYRNSDPKNIYNISLVNRDYDWAPFGDVPSLMENLFSFIANDTTDYFVKAMMVFYFLDYVKPFENHNEAIASLLAKYVLAQGGLDQAASLLPIEGMLRPNNERYRLLKVESQRQNDITYIVLYAIEFLSGQIDAFNAELKKATAEIFNEEKNRLTRHDLPKEAERPVEVASENKGVELKEVPIAPLENGLEKSPLPRIDRSGVGESALYIPEARLSDKEIREYARYILETNPNIRKPQALFYASHSTIGRYYTIQDYKKATRCAYETARTSMDNLAAQGFYKKLQLKNKFVYTPIKQGEK